MIKKPNKISALLLNFFFALLIFSAILTPTVQAFKEEDVCTWINNQSGSAVSEGKQVKISEDLKNKLAVITEEPLGTADQKFSFRCARKTKCTVSPPEEKTATPAVTNYTKRKCVTEYSEVNACSPTASSEITAQLAVASPAAGSTYTTCEIVQIYVSDAGTDLLYHYVGQIYRYIAILGGSLAVLIMIVAGIMISTSGASDQIGKAKAMIVKCITGLVILFLSAVILYTINPNFFVQ